MFNNDKVDEFQESDHRLSGATPVYSDRLSYLKRMLPLVETPPHRLDGATPEEQPE